MNEDFNLIINLPAIFFGICSVAVFLLFIRAGVISLRARKKIMADEEEYILSQKSMGQAVYSFLGLILIVIVFYTVTFLLKKGEVFSPADSGGEIPVSLAINFPPPPQYLKLGDYYFNGPMLLKKYSKINKLAVYAVFCRQNNEYAIMDIESASRVKLLESPNYKCWMENCNKKINDIYVAVLWASSKDDMEAIKNKLVNEIEPACVKKETVLK